MRTVIQNKRTGVIHTRNCNSLKQMHKENIHELEKVDPRHIEGKLNICKHCLDQKQAQKFQAWKYIHEKQKLETQLKNKQNKEQQKYQNKLRRLAKTRDKHLQQEYNKYATHIKKLETQYKNQAEAIQ